ncbi:MAG: aminopeptidase [Desulfonauticus sp.]|jgi:aminopeptidase|nr:MAG: Peptidase M29 aminopeptidase II [Desulfonauticus sp. 38_4375]MDK2921489.1 aminopeptidase [Desulfonauticus sp.]
MFTQEELQKYAQVLIWGMEKARSTKFSPQDIVLIRTDKAALPLANILLQELLQKDLNPLVRINYPPELEKTFFGQARDFQLTFKVPGEEELYSNLNGLISLLAPESLTHLQSVNPESIGKFALAKKYLRDILEKRENQGLFGWTLCLYPTDELANKAGLSLAEYTQEIKKAVFLETENPSQKWETIFRQSETIKSWLNSLAIEYVEVRSKHTQLKVFIGENRRWIGVSGHNIPSFEIFLSPDFRFTEGTYFADQPSYRSGNLVEGVKLTFKQGKVVEVKAKKGEEFVRKQLEMDAGASYLGEFSLTDRRFSPIGKFMANTLFDENFGGKFGNCHIAVGASYADTYAGNPQELTPEKKKELGFNESALHWDLVNTEDKEVIAHLKNGEKITIYKEGEFQVKL